jgi:hypothetical protein
MKTAEEWMEEMFGRLNWSVADTVTLKAIQLDAFKAGMTASAERIRNLAMIMSDVAKPAALIMGAEAIEQARDERKEI